MKLTVIFLVVAGAIAQPARTSSIPTVTPMFMSRGVDNVPAFFVECRNTSNTPVSSGSLTWAFVNNAVRLDGTILQDSGGRIGPGLTMDIQPDGMWRGIIELRQSPSGQSWAVAFGANVRAPLTVPLNAGRHTIAVRCSDTWSDDVIFYWEK
jgi:hypothetical protein